MALLPNFLKLGDPNYAKIPYKNRSRIRHIPPTRCYHPQMRERGSANYQPSSWNHLLVERDQKDDDYQKLLKDKTALLEVKVRDMLRPEYGKPQHLLELINQIDQLGISYRFRDEIKTALHRVRSLDQVTGFIRKDLCASAIYFRLHRQHGYEVYPDVFETFLGCRGSLNFEGMLALYEASHLAFEGEHILDEAKAFSSLHLKDLKKTMANSSISEEIDFALENPYHHRMHRLEARRNIEAYEKRNDKNELLLELAKQDFNLVQTVLQKDLQELSRWWQDIGIAERLSFARDRLVESFFWAVGMTFEPEDSKCRKGLTKAIALITVLDDLYDVYGSIDELQQFTDAVERWNLDAVEQLPDYMKLLYFALFKTVNDLAYHNLMEQGENIVPHLSKAWTGLCKAFLKEAKWNYNNVTPTFEEYIDNAWISSSGAVLLVHSYFLSTQNIRKDAIKCLNNHHGLLRWPSTIFRLYNDISSLKAEMERGETTNAVALYMHETGHSEELAHRYTSQMIEESWKKMNKELLISDSFFEKPFIDIAINLARISRCQYQNGDAHSSPDIRAKERISSVIFRPVV